MRILHLTLKKKWFDMVASGEKKEEYREIKPWASSRLVSNTPTGLFKEYEQVWFKNGYNTSSPIVKVNFIETVISCGNPEWGAEEGKEYFVIKLGEVIHER